jgi:glycogen phosphorylase
MPRAPHIAYFCMEFGLHESFPIYSGGLGILAGDFLKAARDLHLPVVGVGLRWARGAGIQRIGADGHPVQDFAEYEHGFLRDTGVRVTVRVREREVTCSVSTTDRFGHVPLVLLEPMREADRWITARLYESGTDVRVAQEMLLGIGGMRALNWLGIPIAAYHFNEGHAVFAGIEMVAEEMAAGRTLPEAWARTRARIVFTTHTPVKAGNEEHALADLRRMGACVELSDAEMRLFGGDPFNMTVAGLRLSRRANAVSQLHGHTARAMWDHVTDAAPIIAITNGVHVPTWQAPEIRAAAGDPERLWDAHLTLKHALVAAIESRARVAVDPESLIVAFARRAAAYKRPELILHDEARLRALLERHPLTIVLAGKSHPDDPIGREIVTRTVAVARRHPGRVVFLENYDMELAKLLTRGADVWLNNPIRPLEASGTSGMKAGLNGGLNLSILDGWWPEACRHGENGWAIGNEENHDDDADRDALYRVLEGEVLPAWSNRGRWPAMMRASVATIESGFSAERMVREYFENLYAGAEPAPEPPATDARPHARGPRHDRAGVRR